MLRYGTYIFGGDDSLYVVVDDGACLGPQPDRTNAKCVFRVIGVEISSSFPAPGGQDSDCDLGAYV